jgi:hypothetical protein
MVYCDYLNVMLIVVRLNVVGLSVVMLNVVMLSVVAPPERNRNKYKLTVKPLNLNVKL